MLLCDICIQAIRSRGEKIFVGNAVYADDDQIICDWCDEDFDELYEVRVD